ncbi:MAG: hypothetical protein HDS15_05415 [Bacteroides sp.]|nr:hypothetical protein [Bacteroides sp.]
MTRWRDLNHLGVGAHIGTTGFGFEVATPITKFVTARAGITIMPGISFNTEVDGTYQVPADSRTPSLAAGTAQDFTMNVKGSLSRTQGSLIFNVYPLANFSSFYIVAGGYFGGSQIVGVTGHSDELMSLAENASIDLGDYKVPVDQNSNVSGALKVAGFRPYLGLGFGRPVPKGHLNFGVELGVQFMGKMKVYTDGEEQSKILTDNDDDCQKWMDKLTVYPVLKFTLSGNIF